MTTREKLVDVDYLLDGTYDYTLTNGCFDILHRGHVEFLEQAKAHSWHPMVVAVNDDASVQKLKGPTRPINKAEDRAMVIAALECVDYVIIFNDTDVVRLIRKLCPNYWVKGGDYTLDSLNQEEVRAAHESGTNIVIIPFTEGYSTTKVIEAMKAS